MNFPRTSPLPRRASNTAFSLIEILVVAVLLSVIILGLLAMFQQTQKAFRVGLTQTDVLEAGRATMQLLARELEQAQAARTTATNFYADIPFLTSYPFKQDLPGTSQQRSNFHQELFFLRRENQKWIGTGYRVGGPEFGSGIGTLSRYETSCPVGQDPIWMMADFYNRNFGSLSPVVEGLVHFRCRAYDLKGVLLTNDNQFVSGSKALFPAAGFFESGLVTGETRYLWFTNNALPAYVEFEMGILEPRALERVRSLPPSAASAYLAQQAGRVHLFRQRVTVRNVDPSAYE